MATIMLEVPDELAARLEEIDDLPLLLNYAVDLAGLPEQSVSTGAPAPWNEVLDFLRASPTDNDILAYKISESAQNRLEDLIALNNEGRLTQRECDELKSYAAVDHLFIMLKARAREASFAV